MTIDRGRSYFQTKARPRHLAPSPRRRRSRTAIALALVLVAAPLPAALAQQEQPFQAFEITRTYGGDMGVAAPVGVAYRPQSDTLVVVDGKGSAVQVTRAGEQFAPPVALAGDALTLAVDGAGDLVTAAAGALQTTSLTRGPGATRALPVVAAAGAAFDAGTGSLVVLEGNDLVNADTGQRTALGGNGNPRFRGLTIDPVSGLVYVGSPSGRKVHVFDRNGAPVRTLDLSKVEIGNQQGMTIAPSADPTDDPSVQRLYIADASGALVEVAIAPELVIAAAVNSTANLLRTYNTSSFSPPSPDPSGIVWLPYRNQLFISDGEVEEMGIYAGVNLWYVTPSSGANTAVGTTASFNVEPTGVAFDPGSGPTSRRIFISNDQGQRGKVDIVNLGANGEYDLSDTRTSFFVGTGVDSEDLAYHTGNGHLYVTDGAGREVWDVNPGPNGIFQGAGSDDIITHFDMAIHGAIDPDGIAISPTGRLLVLDDPSNSVYELETNGTLVNDISISSAGGMRVAGITLAPASSGSGATSMYIVDRRVDNDNNPNENDGRMYEMTAPLAGGSPSNQPPVANAGPDQQITATPPTNATLNGNLSSDDDAITSYAWAQVSGPAANITSPGSVTTNVSLPTVGTYTFELTVTDGEPLSDTDQITVTVVDPGPGGAFTFNGAVAAGSDDAEQLGNGGIRLANGELELVVKGSDVQTVGLRFPNVTIPQNATITSAYVQFRAVTASTAAAANLAIKAQASDNAPTFTTGLNHISNRPTGPQSVPWNPPTWTQANEAGPNQRTSDLTLLIQAVVSRPGWAPGNALALIITGNGTRVADSIEGGFAPQLVIQYTTP